MRVINSDVLAITLGAFGSDDPRVLTSGNAAVPWELLKAADSALETYRLFMLNAPDGVPARAGVVHETPFVGAGVRQSGRLSYLPCRLSLVPQLLRSTAPPDVVLLNTSLPRDGKVSLGVDVNILPAAIAEARARGGLVVAQLNASMPYTYGDSELLVGDIDLGVEADGPLLAHAPATPTDVDLAIGASVARLVHNDSTLQVGIGAIPDAALRALEDHRGLRVFSEMISDGVLNLRRAGALSSEVVTTSFAAGGAELYAWLHLNQEVIFRRTEVTNSPTAIAAQPRMTSINAALQVDLHAQVNASHIRGGVYSGFGGQSDFVAGALHAPAGTAIIALTSWHRKTNTSTFLATLAAPVTSFQPSVVITEYGFAPLFGRDARDQSESLVAIADPRARDELAAGAAPRCRHAS